MALRELFHGELVARSDMETRVPPEPLEGPAYHERGQHAGGPVSGTLRWSHFETQDERYRWLNPSLGVLEAEIDMRAGRAPRSRAFAAVDGHEAA